MAIEQFIKQGDNLSELKDFDGAISYYNKAIDESPRAFTAYWKRAAAFQKLKQFKEAYDDLNIALSIAQDRGSREQIGLCYYRLGLLKYLEKNVLDASTNFSKALQYNCSEPSLPIWKLKCEKELGVKSASDTVKVEQAPDAHETCVLGDRGQISEEGSTAQSCALKSGQPAHEGSTTQSCTLTLNPTSGEGSNTSPCSLDVGRSSHDASTAQPPNNAPVSPKPKIKDDWYQMDKSVFIAIYAKNVPREQVKVEFSPRTVHLSFPLGSGSEYVYTADPLFAQIDPTKSKYTVYGLKIEIELVKSTPAQWDSLHGEETTIKNTVHLYPTSSKKGTNWNSMTIDEDAQSEDPEDFFNKLYKDVDDDARRAIKKSYIESNGTVLTTNWDEAKQKTFETSPPDGMTSKKWACRSKTPIKAAFAKISISRKMHVEAIPMRWGMGDNYAYLLSDSNTGQSWLIDPAEPVEVESFLAKHKSAYTLKAIVNTHHHYDHSQGNAFFHAKHPQLPIIAGSQSPLVTYTPSNKEVINVGDDLRITALHTPCHTQDSICYYAEDRKTGERAVFTGDTLFISGCGRFFEGTAQEMDQALNGVLASLPKDTKVFPGHEYTKGNVKFTSKILHNDAIKRLEAYTESHSQTTGQFTIGDELEFNPFMRLNDPQVQAATKEHDPTRVMQKLREMKNKM